MDSVHFKQKKRGKMKKKKREKMEEYRNKVKNDPSYQKYYFMVIAILKRMGIPSDMIGYNLLIKAVCIFLVTEMENQELFKFLQYVELVPNIQKEVQEKLKRKHRTSAEQWILEALKASRIDESPMDVIKKISKEVSIS